MRAALVLSPTPWLAMARDGIIGFSILFAPHI